MRNRQQNAVATTIAQGHPSGSRSDAALSGREPRKYDIRVVDQFYTYCQAVARTDRHRDEAHARLRNTLKRSVWTALVSGSFLFYYVMDRAAQAMSLF